MNDLRLVVYPHKCLSNEKLQWPHCGFVEKIVTNEHTFIYQYSNLKMARERCHFSEFRCIMGLQRKDAGSRMSLTLQRPLYFIYMNGFHKWR